MSQAYLDTTILVDLCIEDEPEKAARIRNVILQYDSVQISEYTLKEFRAGPLHNMVAFYNRLEEPGQHDIGTIFSTIKKLDQGGFRRYAPSIAMQAATRITRGRSEIDFARFCDELADLILDAWEEAHGHGVVIAPIDCFDDTGPEYDEETRRFVMPVVWEEPPKEGCCVARCANFTKFARLTVATSKNETKPETVKRVKALRAAMEGANNVDRHQCRHFGDFAVVLFAQESADVLSTNSSDFPLLCQLMKKNFRDPLTD